VPSTITWIGVEAGVELCPRRLMLKRVTRQAVTRNFIGLDCFAGFDEIKV
jgi:hypothetical protein